MIVGFVGLGHMGSALAANLVQRGHQLVAFDIAGADGLPDGAVFVGSVGDVARAADIVVLSLPDAAASTAVARVIAGTADRHVSHIVDTSTIGIDAASEIEALLDEASIVYIDAPVSGGVAGARARTLSLMFAASSDACAAVESVLVDLSDRRYRVGDRPGMAQALKLANNFLSATALAATSEAILFGRTVGLDPSVMLEVINQSSGRNSATDDKFPNHVVTETYSSGFAAKLMGKDVGLYLDSVDARRCPASIGRATTEIWTRFAAAEPDADFTRIFPFVGEADG